MASTQIRGSTQIIGLTVADAQVANAAGIQTSKLADGAKFVKSDGTVTMTAPLNMGGQGITNMLDPVNPQDAATRAWVLANVAGGVVSSSTARAASVGGNLTLSGTQTVDGVALAVGNTILVKDQAAPVNNGLYVVASGAWTRHSSMDTWAEVPGMIVSVQEGTTNHDTIWLSTADASGSLGSTPINFSQIPGPSDVQAGAGLTRTGQVIDVIAADNTLTVNPDSVGVKLDPARAVTVGVSGIGVNIDTNTLVITTNVLGVKPGLYLSITNHVIRETPSGTINGSNGIFTLATTPTSGTEEVFLNGLLLEPGAGNDYQISGGTITMSSAPVSGDRLKVNYWK